jgi:hypothetical protein
MRFPGCAHGQFSRPVRVGNPRCFRVPNAASTDATAGSYPLVSARNCFPGTAVGQSTRCWRDEHQTHRLTEYLLNAAASKQAVDDVLRLGGDCQQLGAPCSRQVHRIRRVRGNGVRRHNEAT